jgi:hypothetical protein
LLNTDRAKVQQAIADARKRAKQGESSWATEQLLWELHPVMQWLLDKVMCRFLRHEAPLIVATKLGKGHAAYLFQGVLSNRRSQPVVGEWFAIHLRPGEPLLPGPFEKLLADTGFGTRIDNRGQPSKLADVVRSKLAEAVKAASQYIQLHGDVRLVRLRERVEEDRQRFELWHQRSLEQIARLRTHYEVSYKGRIPRHLDESLQRRKRGIEDRKEQRGRWLTDTFTVIGTPYLKLAAVFVGE